MRGTKALLRSIDKLISAIQTDVPKAIENEVLTGGVRAEQGFATAQYHGVNDVNVDVSDSSVEGGKGWTIRASGTAVLFIEYGTGIKLKHDSQFGDYGMYPAGSWSATHNQYLTDPDKLKAHHGQWPYAGEWIDGNPSANVMYNTQKNLEQTLLVEAKSAIRKATQ
jgi:hypothetical protein